ncbi:MAG: hypothetical protein ACYCQJ_00890 [Nitrososphaerales archaeon]
MFHSALFLFPRVLGLAEDLIGLFIVWIVVSIPVYVVAKLLTGGRARFSQAMIVTLVGPIVFAIVLAIGYELASSLVSGLGFLALFFAFLTWVWVFKASFGTSWIGAFAIAIISTITAGVIIGLLELAGLLFRHILFSNLIVIISLLV